MQRRQRGRSQDFSEERENWGWRGVQGGHKPPQSSLESGHTGLPAFNSNQARAQAQLGCGWLPTHYQGCIHRRCGRVRRCEHLTEPVLRRMHSEGQALSSKTLWERAAFNHDFSSSGGTGSGSFPVLTGCLAEKGPGGWGGIYFRGHVVAQVSCASHIPGGRACLVHPHLPRAGHEAPILKGGKMP